MRSHNSKMIDAVIKSPYPTHQWCVYFKDGSHLLVNELVIFDDELKTKTYYMKDASTNVKQLRKKS